MVIVSGGGDACLTSMQLYLQISFLFYFSGYDGFWKQNEREFKEWNEI